MKIKIMISAMVFLSASSSFANPSQHTSPSELTWSSKEEVNNCIGNVCLTPGDSKMPGMFDKVDKADRQRMKDPYPYQDKDIGNNQNKTLSLSFGNKN